MTRRRPTALVATAIALALALGACGGGGDGGDSSRRAERAAELPAPLAAGTSAANIPLDSSYKLVLVRWVARSTGRLAALHLRIQADGSDCRRSGKQYYGAGNGGSWLVTSHPVERDGTPDAERKLASLSFRPCEARPPLANVREGIVRVPMDIAVERGREYATVIRNTDPDPGSNYTSPNFLFTETGLLGANGRNERSADARDAYYGLDPRELVGYSHDGGKRWSLPGGPFGKARGRSYLPTYLQEYAGGRIVGQPYYYTSPPRTRLTMTYRNGPRPWVIRGLGAYTAEEGTGELTLSVDGRERARVGVGGRGMLRPAVGPVTVPPRGTVRVTASGIRVRPVVADSAWGQLAGLHLPGAAWDLEDEDNFSMAAPVYPLPWPPPGR